MTSMEDAFKKAGLKPSRQRRDRGGDRNKPPRQDLPKFPDSYFKTDNDDRSYLQPDFVTKRNIDPLAQYLGKNANPPLTTGQLRRFFNHCREIERQLKVDGESWLRVSASFEALCAHAQNAKSARKIPHEFQKFIDDNVERVITAEEPEEAFVNGFLRHFEALVGFGAAHMKKDS